MSGWSLPTTVPVRGQERAIRSDFRAVLDALAALMDTELPESARSAAFLAIMYPDWQSLPDANAALAAALQFVNRGEPVPENQPERPRLVHWNKDAQLIAPAVDKVLGYSCRACAYLHWWDFIGAFYNISGDCLFAQVVNIRNKRAKGKKLDKAEQEFARDNADLIGPTTELRPEEEEFFKRLGVF